MRQSPNYFASNLKYLRLKAQMEQLELAKKIGRKSASSISEWEKGKYTPKSDLLREIAIVFDVTLSALMETDLRQGVTYETNHRDLDNLAMISEKLTPDNYNQLLQYGQQLLDDQTPNNSKKNK
ncbi:helix-turn-helix domain-containing protein [Streptococcus halichoeri]|uniref:helix-turn-helix domain-containing protein n=1 Tax=Streptococcus halichoeri TaxID=254785 RepID=UPI000DAFC5A1|nr:helix-turn-helix transcriptional regulator [Streptococcus halichoeri]PZO96676.1 MAG: transcriptional regulator [Streptococcus pyogenes]